MPKFIDKEDSEILRKLAEKVGKALYGKVSAETSFRFVQENIVRFVDILVGGQKSTVMLALVAEDSKTGSIEADLFEGWDHSPSETSRVHEFEVGSYDPDGSENAELVKNLKKEISRLENMIVEGREDED